MSAVRTLAGRAPVVPADLPERLAAARAEVAELRPTLERVAAVLAEATELATAMYTTAPEHDHAFDQWLTDSGAVALSDELDRITAVVTQP